jgi:polar amino acid transport system substrate-binding protein
VLQRVARTKQLNVAVVVYPPLTENKGGQFSGTFIEASKWLGAQMQANVNYVAAEFGTFIAAIQSGRADIALSGSFATVPRAMAVDFTRSVMWFGSSALVRKADENKWKSIEDGDKQGVRYVQADGTALSTQLQQLLKNAKLNPLPAGTSPANMALEVMSNRADIFVEDDWLVRSLVQQHPELVMMPAYVDKPWGLNAVSWAVAKGQTGMLNVLNVAVDRLSENNKFQEWDDQFGAHWLYKKDTFFQGGKTTA